MPFQLQAHFVAASAVAQLSDAFYFEEVPIKGKSLVDFSAGRAKIEGIKIESTSFKNKVLLLHARDSSSTSC